MRLKNAGYLVLLILFASLYSTAGARPRAPLPDTILDGGIVSAETLGRGNTTASALSSLAAGSENPACLSSKFEDSSYATIYLDNSSVLPSSVTRQSQPLEGKRLQYLSFGAEKGVIFYEPLARFQERQILNAATPGTDFRDVDFSASAIGFAGAEKWKSGSIGISLAYIWSSLNVAEARTGLPTDVEHDTAEGLRMNLGFRHPAGPTMWGISLHNIPGIIWGDEYRRLSLPIRVKMGTTYRLRPGYLFTLEAEERFYREGGNKEEFYFVGQEAQVSKFLTLRVGAYGTDLGKPSKRHMTGGVTLHLQEKGTISFALERFEVQDEAVKQSVISCQIPFQAAVSE